MSNVAQIGRLLPLAIVFWMATAVTPARGETVLRWRFEAGETLRYVTRTKTVGKVHVGPNPIATTTTQVAEMSWAIKSVDADGLASVSQTIDRLRLKMESPQGVMVDYDSAANGETAGISKVLVPFLEAVVNKPISLKVNARGDVSDVQVPQAMIDGMNKVPGVGDMLSGETITQISGLGTLPEAGISKDETWTNEREVKMPVLGQVKVQATYKYLGSEKRGGRKLEKIHFTQQMASSPTKKLAGRAMKLAGQSISGTTYFDNIAGRFAESEVESKLKLQVMTADRTMDTEMSTLSQTKLESAGTSDEPAAQP